jgi:hypothetical protein
MGLRRVVTVQVSGTPWRCTGHNLHPCAGQPWVTPTRWLHFPSLCPDRRDRRTEELARLCSTGLAPGRGVRQPQCL